MPPPLTPYQKRKHQQALDEKYLEKQLVFLTQHKSEILNKIHKYYVKHFSSYRNRFVSIDIVSRLLNINKRTIRLLTVRKYVPGLFFSSYSLFSLIDLSDLIKSLEQHKLGNYSNANKWFIWCTFNSFRKFKYISFWKMCYICRGVAERLRLLQSLSGQ